MKKAFKKGVLSTVLIAALCLPVFSGFLAGCSGGGKTEAGDVSYYSLSQVEITDDYAVNALEKEDEYLLSLDANKLLYWFWVNAGLTPKTSGGYGGQWESALIGGHTMGHYLSALGQAYANAGNSDDTKEEILDRIEYIIDELKDCQDNSQGEEGFIWGGYYSKSIFGNVEFQFDNVENNRTNITSQAWVPWYTMHKIIQGLIDIYNYTGNKTAYTVVCNLGDWVYNRVSSWKSITQAIVLGIEYGGMNDCMYNLYAITGNENYAIAAHMFDEESLFENILSEKADYLNTLHANTTIPKVIGALNRYITCQGETIDGEEVDASEMIEVAKLFWERVVEHHTYITGGNSEWEHFGRDDVLDAERTNANCETCNTYNMLKLSRMLFAITKDVKYLHYYENAYINAIWSSQNPETGMTTYFQPMATGYFKVYSTAETNFWCCTGSGMESMSKLNDSIYYEADGAVYVSLYVDSVLETNKLKLTQSIDLENSDVASFSVEKGSTTLYLRVPDWTDLFEVSVNGKASSEEAQDGFVSIAVSKGDKVTVTMEKKVVAYNLPDGENTYAFKYGPYVLSAELGTANMTTTTTGVNVTVPEAKNLGNLTSEYINVSNGTVENFINHINDYMVKNEDGTFTLTGIDSTLTYSYHFRQHTQRYGLYFYFTGTDVESEQTSSPYEWTTLDTMQPGYGQYEKGMEDNGSVSSTSDTVLSTSRYATAGGSFTYYMKVEKGAENYLSFSLAKEDNGKALVIKSNGTTLYEEVLDYQGTAETYEVQIYLTEEVVNRAADKVINSSGTEETLQSVIPIEISGTETSNSARIGSFVYTKKLDNHLAYFVDCGDYDPTTLSSGDFFGKYNSVTEQLFGQDPVTGKYWGLVDNNANATWTGNAPQGVYSNSTWAYEYNSGDGIDKTASNRYTKNQYESGIARNLHYKFELEDGTYTVIVYFTDPWSCSANPNVSANGEQVLSNVATNKAVEFEVTVSGGYLTLDFTSESLAINIAYIMVLFG